MRLIGESTSTLQADAPRVLNMSTAETTSQARDDGDPEVPRPDLDKGPSAPASSARPDSVNLDGWYVVSETDLTKEMLQHVNKPDEIASLAASYLTRQLFSILDGGLEPPLVDQVFKALEEVSENDENVCRNFIGELNEELESEERPRLLVGNDNEDNAEEEQRRCPRSVVKVMRDLLRFSPVPVEHNILWVRLLSLLSHQPPNLPTFIDLKVAATVLGTMAVQVSSAEIQRWGCRVLEPLAKFRPNPEQKAPVRESGIQVLLRTLDAHIGDPSIVLAVCMVLANLASTMSQFTSWAVQQGYPDEETENLIMMAMSITDYIKENSLTQLDQVGTMYLDHADIQTEFYKIMACFGYHSPASSLDEASPQRKHSILKSPDSPHITCPQRRVTFSYDLDTRVEYQCSDSDSDFGLEEPKRHTVCGGERVSGNDQGEAVFLDADRKNRACKGRVLSKDERKLSFPNFEMEEDYLQMWQHILGEGLFSSICCDLAKLERDFDEMGSGGSLKSSSSNETVDLLDYGSAVDISRPPFARPLVEGPCKSPLARCEMRPERGAARTRFATIPAYRYDFYQPDWQVQDTDAVIRNRLSAENGFVTTTPTETRPMSEPPPRTYFEEEQRHQGVDTDSEDDGDEKTFTEYCEIDLVEALVRSGRMSPDHQLRKDAVLDEDKVELENKGNEEKEHSRERSASEKTIIGVDTQFINPEESTDSSFDSNSNGLQVVPFSLDTDLLPLDRYLGNRSLADDILNSFGIYENGLTPHNTLEPMMSRPYGSFSLHEMSKSTGDPDDVFFDRDTIVNSDCYSGRKSMDFGGEPLDMEYDGNVCDAEEATKQAFAKAFESLRDAPCVFHPSLGSSPTSSVSSASLSLAEWIDLERLTEEEESMASMASMDTVTTQDTPPNSETEMPSPSSHSFPKQRKMIFMHRFSERNAQNYPPPKPRRTWYYRSSADVRKSLVSSFALEVDAALGSDAHGAKLGGRSLTRSSKRGLSLLAFGKSSTSVSCDSGVMTGDDDECPAGTNQEPFPEEHFYEEVYMSKAELKPTLYERISRKGHYAEVKKANKVQVQEDSSSEATYAVCTLWVNNHCVEALVSFDHLTKQLLSPYSILPAVRQLEGIRKSSFGDSIDEMESDYPAWTSILNVLATEESKWTLSLAAQVLPVIDRLFYTKDEAIMDASVGLVQLLIRKFGAEIEKHHSGGLFRTRFRDDCRTCFMWLNKLCSRVTDLLKRDARREDDLDSLLHLSLLNSLRETLKPFNGRISRGMVF